jgi:hypothetical protein
LIFDQGDIESTLELNTLALEVKEKVVPKKSFGRPNNFNGFGEWSRLLHEYSRQAAMALIVLRNFCYRMNRLLRGTETQGSG